MCMKMPGKAGWVLWGGKYGKASYIPERGDILWITLDPHRGHEQAGRRPSLVLSPKAYNNRVKLALICPITSHAKGYPFEVLLEAREGKIGGVILADKVRVADWQTRKAVFIEKAPQNILEEVIEQLISLLTEE